MEVKFEKEDFVDAHITASRFLSELLKGYKSVNKTSVPNFITKQEWDAKLDDMIYAFEQVANSWPDEPIRGRDKEQFNKEYCEYMNKVTDGIKLFRQYFLDLWE